MFCRHLTFRFLLTWPKLAQRCCTHKKLVSNQFCPQEKRHWKYIIHTEAMHIPNSSTYCYKTLLLYATKGICIAIHLRTAPSNSLRYYSWMRSHQILVRSIVRITLHLFIRSSSNYHALLCCCNSDLLYTTLVWRFFDIHTRIVAITFFQVIGFIALSYLFRLAVFWI